MPGPLPDENRRRRNAPTIPSTDLNPNGPGGRAPTVPKWMELGTAGNEWWKWAWKTPQACAWGRSAGFEPLIARRASLEDDLSTIARVEALDLNEVLSDEARQIISRLAAMATGRLAIMREMRELDDRLGLTPKGMAALRWRIVATPETPPAQKEDATKPGTVTSIGSRRKRLTADAS